MLILSKSYLVTVHKGNKRICLLPSSDTTRDDDQGRVRSFLGVVESRKVGLPD